MARWLITLLGLLVTMTGFAQEEIVNNDDIPRVEGEMIVKFKSSNPHTEEDILKILAEHIKFHQFGEELAKKTDVEIIEKYAWANIYHVKISTWDDFSEKIEEIRKLDEVEYVEPNYLLKAESSVEAIEAEGASEAGGSEAPLQLSPEALQNCDDVVVAVIDTGVDYTHVDLAPHMWTNPGEIPGNQKDDDKNGYTDDVLGWDFVNNDNDPYDDHYHGTHVAGIVLKVQDPKNPTIKIMPLKFLSGAGWGSLGDAIRAIDYAVRNGAKILSNSWGGGSFSYALRDAISASYYANRVFVVAAGNSAVNIDQYVSYPPSYLTPNMITVAALTDSSSLAWFSNWGPYTVHVGAPGVSIKSAAPKESCGAPPCYKTLSGTSMATPHVSGIAALMLCENPDLMHLQVKDIVMETSVSNAALQGYIGKGKVSGDDAIQLASTTEPDKSAPPPFTPAEAPATASLTAKNSLGVMGAGCAAITDITNSQGGGGSSGSLLSLCLPFFILIGFRFFQRRRELLFCEF